MTCTMSEIRKSIHVMHGDSKLAMLTVKYSRIKNIQSNIVREHDLLKRIITVPLNWIVTPLERIFSMKLKLITDNEQKK